VLGLWELAGRVPVSLAFPTASATAVALWQMTLDGRLPAAYLVTAKPLAIGLAVCGVLGVACGIGMGLSRAFEWLTLPVFVVLQAAPMAALVPLITYVYGIGLTAKVLAVVFLAMPVVVMNAYKGIRNTPPSLVEMCRSFQGTRAQTIAKVVLPSASGLVFAGLRLGLAMGFVGVVVAELLITPTGIGDLITYHGSVADYPEMFATIASMVLIAAVSVSALEALERRLFPPDTRAA
jgi:NitT/TauT family transport system permease protein